MGKSAPQREADRLQAEERRRQVMQLRVGGASMGEIARSLNLSKSTVHGHVRKALDDLAKQDLGRTAAYRALALERLDRLLLGVWPKATGGTDIKATREARSIVQAQARLLGLEAPVKIAHTDPTGTEERNPRDWIMPVPTEQDPQEWATQMQVMMRDREAQALAAVAQVLEAAGIPPST